MSPQQCGIRFRGPQKQRGAIGLMAAVTLGMALLFMLLVVDSGRLYFEQRKLQRVADMAVLEAVTQGGTCASGTAATYANTSATRNGFTPDTVQKINTTCGTLVTGSDSLRTFKLDASKSDAIRVIATTVAPTSVAGGLWSLFSDGKFELKTNLTASAVGATTGPTLAQISIRTTLLTVSTSQSLLLNSLFSKLLGGNVDISAVGWEGLAKADINLLQYLNQLAINLDVTAGDYTKLLSADATVTQLIDAAVTAATLNGATLEVLSDLAKLQVAAINEKPLKLGDILKLQTGTTTAGLNGNVNVLSLIQAAIQLSNKNNVASLSLPIDLLGLAKVTTQIKIIEPPQFSSIGNPATDKIYVRTAQVRTLISVELPVLNTIASLLTTVTDLLAGLLSVLIGTHYSIAILPPPLLLSVNLDVGGADATVTAYSCPANGTGKSLTVEVNTAAAKLNIGHIDESKVFSSSAPVTVTPFPIINIKSKSCLVVCGPYVDYGGGGVAIKANLDILRTPTTLIYSASDATTPPNLKQPPMPKSASPTKDIVASLKDILNNIPILLYAPADSSGVLGALVTVLTDTVNVALKLVVNIAKPLITAVLSPIVDPLVNNLLSLLGVNLMKTEVDANLSCGSGGRAQLVL
ncbi:MAG: pilus assembly protein TadG-related protein [Pseudomonadota bacterium]